jgi:hypothetical protein
MLDAATSSVTLLNPHHGNSPDLDDQLPPEQDTGIFTLPLEKYLRFFGRLGYARIARLPS